MTACSFLLSFKEANGELSWDDEDMAANYTWTLNELIDQFSELYSWLNSIQEAVYGKGGIVVDKNFKTVSNNIPV